MPKILMNGRFSVVNVWIWYAKKNYDNRKTGFMKELKTNFRKIFITLMSHNSQQNANRPDHRT
ncbi:hypothetical protein CLV93_1162 [Prolixibacter denitrificans]|uniref:Uncharacterized protein n=1 Tax=Prolixibacter denitrificans TaxID=1541063 RepID=A0A2P8C625_9BACT|nr:hypothetical protein CLV93_1162 [Prolixibacter denitrificans]